MLFEFVFDIFLISKGQSRKYQAFLVFSTLALTKEGNIKNTYVIPRTQVF